MENTLIIYLMLIFFILMLFNQYLYKENFSNYLFPIKGLTKECKGNLKPAYMPTSCVKNGKLKPFSNCKCVDENGDCKICYDEIKKESKGKPISYNPDEFNLNQDELNKRLKTYIETTTIKK